MDDAGDTAIAIVTCSWYGLSDMSLHETVIQQTWESFDGTFALVEERVVRGDPSLLLDDEPEPAKAAGAEREQASLQSR
jgi:hypothetical protein